jgi:hypothetical protein
MIARYSSLSISTIAVDMLSFKFNFSAMLQLLEVKFHSDISIKSLFVVRNNITRFPIFSEKNGKSSYIWLDKFPNEQFKQTLGISQNGLKVSLYSSWHFSCCIPNCFHTVVNITAGVVSKTIF